MHPVLLPFPGVTSYGVSLLAAWGVGWWLARRRSCRCGIPVWHIDWLAPLLLAGAAVGSRLSGRLLQTLGHGGGNDRLLYGALLGALGVAAVYAKIARLPLARLCDAFVLSLPAGIVLLRVGCFLGGCCWGDICVAPERLSVVADPVLVRQVQTIPSLCGEGWPLAVTFPAGSPAYLQHRSAGLLPPTARRSLPVHPVQLYEAAAVLTEVLQNAFWPYENWAKSVKSRENRMAHGPRSGARDAQRGGWSPGRWRPAGHANHGGSTDARDRGVADGHTAGHGAVWEPL